MTRDEVKAELRQLEEWWTHYQALAAQAPKQERRAAVLRRLLVNPDPVLTPRAP